MVLTVVKFGTPVLRQRGARIEEITPAMRKLSRDMLETMHAYKGVGLAAQQVGVPVQLTVLDVRGVNDRPSTLEVDGQQLDPSEFMPLVLINPEITPLGPPVPGAEGCLSFPEIYAEIPRPELIEVKARDEDGQPLHFRCGGLLARAVQHETDHLNGILFIDRMSKETKQELRPELELLQAETKEALNA
jgi:peptide deformylase